MHLRHRVALLLATIAIAPRCGGDAAGPSELCDPEDFPDAAQWAASAGGNDHLYRLVTATTDVSWEDAESASRAAGEGWHLATITTAAENDFVEAILATDPAAFNCCLFPVPVGRIAAGPWLGARASRNGSNDWAWVTAEPFSFADWGPLEPFGNGDRISYAEFGAGRVIGWNDSPSMHPLNPRAYVRECSPDLGT